MQLIADARAHSLTSSRAPDSFETMGLAATLGTAWPFDVAVIVLLLPPPVALLLAPFETTVAEVSLLLTG